MITKISSYALKIILLILLMQYQYSIYSQNTYDDNNPTGIYSITNNYGFNYAEDRSFGDFYVFENTQKQISVFLIKSPVDYVKKRTFRKYIYQIILKMYNIKFYPETKRSSSRLLKFAGQKKSLFMRFGKDKKINPLSKVYIFLIRSQDKIFHIMIEAQTGEEKPPEIVLNFLENIKVSSFSK